MRAVDNQELDFTLIIYYHVFMKFIFLPFSMKRIKIDEE